VSAHEGHGAGQVAGVAVKRIGVGRIWHESNSFFAVPTTLDAVERQMDVLRDAIRHYN